MVPSAARAIARGPSGRGPLPGPPNLAASPSGVPASTRASRAPYWRTWPAAATRSRASSPANATDCGATTVAVESWNDRPCAHRPSHRPPSRANHAMREAESATATSPRPFAATSSGAVTRPVARPPVPSVRTYRPRAEYSVTRSLPGSATTTFPPGASAIARG